MYGYGYPGYPAPPRYYPGGYVASAPPAYPYPPAARPVVAYPPPPADYYSRTAAAAAAGPASGYGTYPATGEAPYGVPINVDPAADAASTAKAKKKKRPKDTPPPTASPPPTTCEAPPALTDAQRAAQPGAGKTGLYVPPGRRGAAGGPSAAMKEAAPAHPPQASESSSAAHSRGGTSGSSRDGGDLGDAESDAHSSEAWAASPTGPVFAVEAQPHRVHAPALPPAVLAARAPRSLRHVLLGHLNKLCDASYEGIRGALLEELDHVDEHYELLVSLLYDQVVVSPSFAQLYARLAEDLCEEAGAIETNATDRRTRMQESPFRMKLLVVCEQRFEQIVTCGDVAFNGESEAADEALEDARSTLGFLAALFERQILGTGTMLKVILRRLWEAGEASIAAGERAPPHLELLTLVLAKAAQGMYARGTPAQVEAVDALYADLEDLTGLVCTRLRFLIMNLIDAHPTRTPATPASSAPRLYTTPKPWTPSQQ